MTRILVLASTLVVLASCTSTGTAGRGVAGVDSTQNRVGADGRCSFGTFRSGNFCVSNRD